VPDAIKAELQGNQSLEFIWRGSHSLPKGRAEILTHVLDTHYESPTGFDWEPPAQAGVAVPVTRENVAQRADAFMQVGTMMMMFMMVRMMMRRRRRRRRRMVVMMMMMNLLLRCQAVAQKAEWYRTPLVLVPLGGDFEYQVRGQAYGSW
jgi:hypothetical protein